MFVRGHLVVFYTIKNKEYCPQHNWLLIKNGYLFTQTPEFSISLNEAEII
jgi:hypothetical protein